MNVPKAPENIRDLIFLLITTQEESLKMLNVALADLETIKIALWTLNPDPGFSTRLEEAMKANRDRHASELARRLAELVLLRSVVPKIC